MDLLKKILLVLVSLGCLGFASTVQYSVGINDYLDTGSYSLVSGYVNMYNVVPMSSGIYQGTLAKTLYTSGAGGAVFDVSDNQVVNFVAFRSYSDATAATAYSFQTPPYKNFGDATAQLCQTNFLDTSTKLWQTNNKMYSCATSMSIPLPKATSTIRSETITVYAQPDSHTSGYASGIDVELKDPNGNVLQSGNTNSGGYANFVVNEGVKFYLDSTSGYGDSWSVLFGYSPAIEKLTYTSDGIPQIVRTQDGATMSKPFNYYIYLKSQPQPSPSCNAPYGNNPYYQGTATYGSSSYTDYCYDSTHVHKYDCENGQIGQYNYDCGSGYVCSNGACVSNQPPSSCYAPNSNNIYVQGTASIGTSSYTDYCYDSTHVHKYGCANNNINEFNYDCGSGYQCINGACIAQQTSCNSPYGDSIFVQGTTTLGSNSYTDYCIDSAKLHKYSCYNGKDLQENDFTCPVGFRCAYGACAASSPSYILQVSVVENAGTASPVPHASVFVYDTDNKVTGQTTADSAGQTDAVVPDNSWVYILATKDGVTYSANNQGLSGYFEYDTSKGQICSSNDVCPITHIYLYPETQNPTPPTPPAPPEPALENYTLYLSSGWNLLSIPFSLADVVSNTCGSTSGFTYGNGNYVQTDLSVGKRVSTGIEGFWVKSKTGSCSMTFQGQPTDEISADSLQGTGLVSGWNLIGSPATSTAFTSLQGTCVVQSGPWGYDTAGQKWVKSTTLAPGHGYFVKVAGYCTLGGEAPPPLPGS